MSAVARRPTDTAGAELRRVRCLRQRHAGGTRPAERRGSMALSPLCQSIGVASLLFACAGTQPTPRSATPPALQSEYITVIPDVTYSRTGQDAASEQAAIGAEEDVMASILAIPPGGRTRHDACTGCPAED
jgi:hypothetical protein